MNSRMVSVLGVLILASSMVLMIPSASAKFGLNQNKICNLKIYVYYNVVTIDEYPWWVYSDPVEGAAVTVQGRTVITDASGLAYFPNIVNNLQMTPYTVSKPGYQDYSGTAVTWPGTTPAPKYVLTYHDECALTPLIE